MAMHVGEGGVVSGRGMGGGREVSGQCEASAAEENLFLVNSS